jgi:uncharacterized RDD family membrane protein YckC
MNAASPSVPAVPPYAGLVTRVVAFVLDLLIINGLLLGISIAVGLVIEAFGTFSPDVNLGSAVAAGFVWGLASAAYFVTGWSLTGQTPGMRAMGVKVLTADGGSLVRPRRGLLRVIGMVLAALPLMAGYLPILVSDRRQGFHDYLARTVVVYVERERPPVPSRRAVAADS